MEKTRHYFAYGSNMNPARVRGRAMRFQSHQTGHLVDYQLAFNKRSAKFPGSASANVMARAGMITEGVLYQLEHPDQIQMMDPYEGFPRLYRRFSLPINCAEGTVNAWVYIANAEHVDESLKPNRWYLEHLLAGKQFLSDGYFRQLTMTECLPDSDLEPL